MRRKSVSYSRFGYMFSLPFILAFLVFSFYPVLYTAVIGFTDMKGVIPKPVHLLDNPFGNFADLIMHNTSFRISLTNTALIWILNFIPQIGLALLLTAWFTNQRLKVRGQGAFKVLLYMPNIITASTIAVLFNSLFSYPMGPVNSLFESLGWIDAPVNFLQDKTTARGIVAFIQFWMWYGNTMIILIAGVMGINPALFEAASIDGANGWQTFMRITLPSLKTIMLYTLITSMIGGASAVRHPAAVPVRRSRRCDAHDVRLHLRASVQGQLPVQQSGGGQHDHVRDRGGPVGSLVLPHARPRRLPAQKSAKKESIKLRERRQGGL
ncbi:carbohydrate ABC transporter permease [Cohnella rhizosphaerae]|uniref:Sugar ABC transporter permease n=1 Tax=Cohnella rhizosphaerae TaxID=1457232 RepID=A0A9X4KWF6_9BACL|nr:sugar ABC transporter permease [Cohnella rhizosphaerae]MDG0809287.1 sugar ABC transporter permease [Cohnella rhizosphaerae]